MGSSFESEEATRPRRALRLLGIVQRVVLVLVLEGFGRELWGWSPRGVTQAIDMLTEWLVNPIWIPRSSTASLLVHLVVLGLAGRALALLAREVTARRAMPRETGIPRVDASGLHAGDRLVVARPDVSAVAVSTDADLGFALVATTRDGATFRIPQRSESSARGLAEALGGEPTASLVFEGVSSGRWRETRGAGLAALRFVVLAALANLLAFALNTPDGWSWFGFHGYKQGIRYTLAWWLGELSVIGLLPVAASVALVLAIGAVVRRLRPASVRVGPHGVQAGERTIAASDIAAVEADAASDVTFALRDGKKVRLSFGADRPLVERDLFVARVRAMAEEADVETYPAAETSGVRVALSPEALAPEEEDATAEEEEASAPARPRRGAR
jgi:hypothetical protein